MIAKTVRILATGRTGEAVNARICREAKTIEEGNSKVLRKDVKAEGRRGYDVEEI